MSGGWTASWTQAVTDLGAAGQVLDDVTLRIAFTGSLDADRVRVVLGNRWGSEPLRIGRAGMATRGATAPVLFGGSPEVTVPAGDEVTSDAVALRVGAGAAVDVDLYLPERTQLAEGNISASSWRVSATGDHCGAPELPGARVVDLALPDGTSLPFPTPILRGLEVSLGEPVPVVVCLGDSITAAGWPEGAAARLRTRGKRVAVLNRGISGNRLLRPGAGPLGGFFGTAGVARFDHDVLGTPGRTHVLVPLGTNDLGHAGTHAPEDELPSVDDLVEGLAALVARAREAGLGALLATIIPCLPAEGYDARREPIRRAVNDWVRTGPGGAHVVDLDAAVRDAADPSRLAEDCDSGDHLHPNETGQARLAEAAAVAIG